MRDISGIVICRYGRPLLQFSNGACNHIVHYPYLFHKHVSIGITCKGSNIEHIIVILHDLIVALVTMLAKCGALQEANAYLISMPHGLSASYMDYRWYQVALYASSCVQHKEETLHTMQPPNNHLITFASLIKSCGSTCDLEKGKRFHADAETKGLTSVLFISISLIRMYSKCGCPIDAEFIFMGLSKRDVFSWNAMLSTYLENDRPVNALLGFRQLLEEKLFSPDVVTFTIVLGACATLGGHENVVVEGEINCIVFQEIGRALHSHIRKKNVILDAFINDAMVNMYGKCGSVREAIYVHGGVVTY